MRGHAPVRMKKVHEGKIIWNGFPKAMSYNEKLHDLFIYRYTLDDGFSIKETSLITNPHHATATSKSGAPRPLQRSIDITKRRIRFFHKWARNMGIVIAPQLNSDKEWILYNMQRAGQLKEYEKAVERAVNGAKHMLEIKKTIIAKGAKVRRRIAERTSQEIYLSVRRRRNKKAAYY